MPPQSFSKNDDDLSKRVQDLEVALAAAQALAPATQIPEHGGGDGTTIAPTWSAWEQYLATGEAQNWQGHPYIAEPPPVDPPGK